MARLAHHRPALEADPAALRRPVAVFGAEQVTSIQPASRPHPNTGPATAPAGTWQATLLEETPCSSPCT